MKAIRKRYQFKFWLDANKPVERELGHRLETLKAKRKYVTTIRDALRLLFSLRDGDTSVLLEMHPWVADAIGKRGTSDGGGGGDNLNRKLEAIESLLLQQVTTQSGGMLMKPALPTASTFGPKALAVPTFELPTFEDDDLETVVLKKDTSNDSAANFLNSLMSLQQ